MGINPTGLFKAFNFDGDSSVQYGAFLTGEGVFNAPERAVEMIEIPGRNGSFAMDQGRFENIEVTYKGGLVDYTEEDFADRISNLRNWLCSKVGYVRLEDDYNPDEYRMAIYKSGLDVDHVDLLNGEFDLVFECKPQRWLKSGEAAVAVANNGTLVNPTLFDASPLLEVKGYGEIHFNGFDVEIENVTLGNILIADGDSWAVSKQYTFDSSLLNANDSIFVNCQMSCIVGFVYSGSGSWTTTISDTNALYHSTYSLAGLQDNKHKYLISTNIDPIEFNKGIASSETNTVAYKMTAIGNFDIAQSISYDGDGTVTLDIIVTLTQTGTKPLFYEDDGGVVSIMASSTISALGNPTYIDCDLGECYMIKNSDIVSLNGVIDLGSSLPVLASDSNIFTYDNTITELKVVPRWWRV